MTEDEFRSGGVPKPAAFDYMAEADKTCSIVFAPQFVNRDTFVRILRDVAQLAEELNIAKKLLFRGKQPNEVGCDMPALSASLAVEFDPNNSTDADINLLHGIVGVITEAGEMAEVLLHRIVHGKFDGVNAAEECGDVLWYLARQLRGLETNFDQIGRMNIDKLHGRHGDAFDVFRDANRNLAAERKRLEADAPLFETTDAPAMGVASGASEHPGYHDADAPIPPERAMGRETRRGALPPVVGIPPQRTDPPGVGEYLKRNAGDVEGMDC